MRVCLTLLCLLVATCVASVPENLTTTGTQYVDGSDLLRQITLQTDDTLSLDSTHILGTFIARDVDIVRPVMLSNCNFDGDVTLSGCKVSSEVVFFRCMFGSTLRFEDIEFDRDFSVGGCTFWDKFEMRNCTLNGWADFIGANFNDSSEFENVMFGRLASFRFTEARSRLDFSRCTFEESEFWSSDFYGTISFSRCRFQDELSFRDAAFANGLNLGYSILEEPALLNLVGIDYLDDGSELRYSSRGPLVNISNVRYTHIETSLSDASSARPLLYFGEYSSIKNRKGWKRQLAYYELENPEQHYLVRSSVWAEIEHCYGKLLTSLRNDGWFVEYDLVMQEFHDLETQYKWYHGEWMTPAFNLCMKWICGYGVIPQRAFKFSFWVVLFFAGVYWFSYHMIHPRVGQIDFPSRYRTFRSRRSWYKKAGESLLFSVNTYFSVGYDNHYPVGWLR